MQSLRCLTSPRKSAGQHSGQKIKIRRKVHITTPRGRACALEHHGLWVVSSMPAHYAIAFRWGIFTKPPRHGPPAHDPVSGAYAAPWVAHNNHFPESSKNGWVGNPFPWPHGCSGSGTHGQRPGSEWQKARQVCPPYCTSKGTAKPPSCRSALAHRATTGSDMIALCIQKILRCHIAQASSNSQPCNCATECATNNGLSSWKASGSWAP